MMYNVLLLSGFILTLSRVAGDACPAGNIPVVKACQADSVEGSSVYVDFSFSVDLLGLCSCSVQALNAEVEAQVSAEVVSSTCNVIIYINDFFLQCDGTKPTSTSYMLQPGKDSYVTLMRPQKNSTADICLLFEQINTGGQMKVNCLERDKSDVLQTQQTIVATTTTSGSSGTTTQQTTVATTTTSGSSGTTTTSGSSGTTTTSGSSGTTTSSSSSGTTTTSGSSDTTTTSGGSGTTTTSGGSGTTTTSGSSGTTTTSGGSGTTTTSGGSGTTDSGGSGTNATVSGSDSTTLGNETISAESSKQTQSETPTSYVVIAVFAGIIVILVLLGTVGYLKDRFCRKRKPRPRVEPLEERF